MRTGAVARVAQLAPHLDRSVNDGLRLDRQAHLLPLWSLSGRAAGAEDAATRGQADAVEQYLCEIAGIEPAELASHDVLTYPTEAPGRIGRHGEMLASSRLDNLSSVQAGLVALEALAAGAGVGGTYPLYLNFTALCRSFPDSNAGSNRQKLPAI